MHAEEMLSMYTEEIFSVYTEEMSSVYTEEIYLKTMVLAMNRVRVAPFDPILCRKEAHCPQGAF